MNQPVVNLSTSKATVDENSRTYPVRTAEISQNTGPTASQSTNLGVIDVHPNENANKDSSKSTTATVPDPQAISNDMHPDAAAQNGRATNDSAVDSRPSFAPSISLGPSVFSQQRQNVPSTLELRKASAEQITCIARIYTTSQEARRQAQQGTKAQDETPIYQAQNVGTPEDPHAMDVRYHQAKRAHDRKQNREGVNTREELRIMALEKDFQDVETRRKNPGNEKQSQDDNDITEYDTEDDSGGLFVHNAPRKRSRNGKAKPNAKSRSKPSQRKQVAGSEDEEEDERPATKKPRGRPAAKRSRKAKNPPAKRKKINKSTSRNIQNLHSSNIIEDAEAAEGLAKDQPGFDLEEVGGSRAAALRAIINNVPEVNRNSARADKHVLENSIKDFCGQGSVKPAAEGRWLLRGMTSSLEPHQVFGAGFMRKRESGPEDSCKGGILADQMGLGKTVMALANIVNGRPDPKKMKENPDQPLTTLIVVTPALLSQWVAEVRKHTASAKRNQRWGINSVVIYRESDTNFKDESSFNMHDVVLTTYTEVSRSWPVIEKPDMPPGPELDDWMEKNFYSKRGLLHLTEFKRVILDEAHSIRNVDTLVSRACCGLQAEFYWAMTGTPMVNGAIDLYALFQFIHHPRIKKTSCAEFKKNFISKHDPMSTELLSDDLTACMTRYTHRDQLFGARIISIPKGRSQRVSLHFTRLEKEIYNIVKTRFMTRVKKLSDDGQLMTKYQHVFTLILRLRQLTSHPLMIQGTIAGCLEREDFERLEKVCEAEDSGRGVGKKVILSLRNMLVKESKMTGTAAEHQDGTDEQYEIQLPASGGRVHGEIKDAGGHHGMNLRFSKYLSTIKDSDICGRMNARTQCTLCYQLPDTPYITSCFHIYCQQCLEDLMHEASVDGQEGALCKKEGCRLQIQSTKPIALTANTSGERSSESGKRNKKGDSPKDTEDWLDMNGEVLPSTKTMAVKSQILNWWDTRLGGDPKDKIIVFTQWRGMVRVLAAMCEAEKWGYCTLTGDLSQKKRDAELQQFKHSPACGILIASLKCGGLGLNLAEANRVLIVDPWWNDAVEQQAFSRVFRRGQTKESTVVYLSVEDSIDMHLFKLKKKKTEEIDKVMLDHKARKKIKLKNLLSLLGEVQEDADGRVIFLGGDDDSADEQGII